MDAQMDVNIYRKILSCNILYSFIHHSLMICTGLVLERSYIYDFMPTYLLYSMPFIIVMILWVLFNIIWYSKCKSRIIGTKYFLVKYSICALIGSSYMIFISFVL